MTVVGETQPNQGVFELLNADSPRAIVIEGTETLFQLVYLTIFRLQIEVLTYLGNRGGNLFHV